MNNGKRCIPCRYRKVKCDGVAPECTPCRKGRRKLECTYDETYKIEPTSRYKGVDKGQACLPCRQKKKRCDAARPHCNSCKASGIECECVYRNIASGNLPEGNPTLRKIKPAPPRSIEPAPQPTASTTSSSLSPVLRSSGSPYSLRDLFPAGFQPHARSSRNHLFPINSAFGFGPIRAPLLLHDGPRSSAFSDVSLDDMNLNFRILFLSRRLQFGFYLPFSKQQAILSGDISNTVIHPFFIHFANALGSQFYQEREKSFCFLYLIGINMQLAWEALASMREEDDPFLMAQARFFKRSVGIVKKYGMRFFPVSSNDAMQPTQDVSSAVHEYSEEAHERVALLAKLIYAETYLYFLTGEHDNACSDLEEQFRFELPDAYPILFKICPIMLRVRSVLLMKDTHNIVADRRKESLSSLVEQCQSLLSSLKSHLDYLASRMIEFTEISDHESCLSLRYSMIMCSTTQAELYQFLATNSPSPSSSWEEYRRQCQGSLKSVVYMTRGLRTDDFDLLDPLIGICWSHAISVLWNEQSSLPLLTTFGSESGINASGIPSTSSLPISESQSDPNIVLITQSRERLEVKVHAVPTTLCQQLADMNYRRQPGTPNYLLEHVRLSLGL